MDIGGGALQAPARQSLERGPLRVACCRYLMLCALGAVPPDDLRRVCEAHLLRLLPQEVSRMKQSVVL